MSTPTALTIPRVTVLTGHTSPETAYVVDDYPYGPRLRCKIRYWIETGKTGATKGHERFVSQTTNPKQPGEVWNKPKPSGYDLLKVMYLNDEGHVKPYGIPVWIEGHDDTRTRHMGVYDALTEGQRRQYDALLAMSRRVNPSTWKRWDCVVSLLAHHIADGEDVVLCNGVWMVDGKPMHSLSDPAAYVTAARDLLDNPHKDAL